jgi:predicted membrane metal-binding protein
MYQAAGRAGLGYSQWDEGRRVQSHRSMPIRSVKNRFFQFARPSLVTPCILVFVMAIVVVVLVAVLVVVVVVSVAVAASALEVVATFASHELTKRCCSHEVKHRANGSSPMQRDGSDALTCAALWIDDEYHGVKQASN